MLESLDLSSLQKAINSLERVINAFKRVESSPGNEDYKEAIQSGVIQHFEFTYELCWKFMKRWLEINLGKTAVEGIARKELFRLAAENILIDDVESWFLFHRARNETSHTYDEDKATEVYNVALIFLIKAKVLLRALEQKK